jgi:hypothetical protein
MCANITKIIEDMLIHEHKLRKRMHSEMKRKTSFPFAFHSFFRNFVRILSFSLDKGSLGI